MSILALASEAARLSLVAPEPLAQVPVALQEATPPQCGVTASSPVEDRQTSQIDRMVTSAPNLKRTDQESLSNTPAVKPRTKANLEPKKDLPPQNARTNSAVENALTALVKYVPTEVITLYIAAVSVGSAFKSVIPDYSPTLLYWIFIVLTPMVFYLVYLSQMVSMNQSIPNVKNWPRWKPTASTIAFAAWALAIPNNPYIQGEAGAAVAGFAVIFVSIMLSLVSPIVERRKLN